MHFVFMPYGKRSEVELLLRDMEAQKHFLKNTDGTGQWIQGQIRVLPCGIYEYVFPKEDADCVLWTLLTSSKEDRYDLGSLKFWFLTKALRIEKVPEFNKSKQYLWIKDNVNIIPLGVRYDGEIYDDLIKKTHEAI